MSTEATPSFLEMIGASDADTDPERRRRFTDTLAEHRESRARRDPAVTAALRSRFGVNPQANAA